MENNIILQVRRLAAQKEKSVNSLLHIKILAVIIVFFSIAVAFSVAEYYSIIFITAVPLLLLQVYSSVIHYKIFRITKILRLYKAQINAGETATGKLGSAGLALKDGFFIIFLCFDLVWLLSAYILPSPANSFTEYASRLQIGPISGIGFLIFTLIFWLVYTLLFFIGGYTEKELKDSGKEIVEDGINRIEFSLKVNTFNNEKININGYRIPNKGKQPLILLPGFTQNGYVYDLMKVSSSLAEYLWQKGYDIWIFHPRGTAGSGFSKYSNSLDDFACDDIPAIVNFVKDNTKMKPLLAAHSQGGITSIISMMGVQKNTSGKVSLSQKISDERQAALKGLITFGSYPDFKFKNQSSIQDFVNTGLKINIFNKRIKIINSSALLKLTKITKYLPVPVGYKLRNALLSQPGLSTVVFPLKWGLNKISQFPLWQFLYNIPNVFFTSRKYIFFRTMDGTFPAILSQFYDAIKTGNMSSSDKSVNYSGNYGSIKLPVSFVAMELDTLADPPMMKDHMFDKISSTEKHFTEWKAQGHEDFFMNPDYFRQVFFAINLIDKQEHDPGDNDISNILMNCEESGLAPEYKIQKGTYLLEEDKLFNQRKPERTESIIFKTKGEEIFVVSDLHIAAGKNKVGVFRGTENFFDDDSFKRFLEHADKIKKTPDAILVINGDIFDFLRVVDFPGRHKKVRLSKRIRRALKFNPIKPTALPEESLIVQQYQKWSSALSKIGMKKNVEELSNSISERERKYGLKTTDFKCIWKLELIREGHKLFFEALAGWLQNNNNKLIIMKGNHDLELSWLSVRNYLRLILAETISAGTGKEVRQVLNNILPRIFFIDDSIVIDDDFYVEHGHRYDKYTMILDDPVLDVSTDELNIPFGSFFNRYLINRVELFYPFLDNVRPSGNLLPMLMRENFPLGIKVLFQHGPMIVRVFITNRKYVKYIFARFIFFFLAFFIPAFLIFKTKLWEYLNDTGGGSTNLHSIIFGVLQSIGVLLLSYLLARLAAWFQLEEPDSLERFARERFVGTDYRIMTMGHTHNPGSYKFEIDDEEKLFYNTGTWIPVIETTTADIREDKTYTYLHLKKDDKHKYFPVNGILQRWNDNAGRGDPQILVERK